MTCARCGHNRSVHSLDWNPFRGVWDRSCRHEERGGREPEKCGCLGFVEPVTVPDTRVCEVREETKAAHQASKESADGGKATIAALDDGLTKLAEFLDEGPALSLRDRTHFAELRQRYGQVILHSQAHQRDSESLVEEIGDLLSAVRLYEAHQRLSIADGA